MDQFEKEQVKKMNATLREIAKAFTRLANEIVKLREVIERNGYAVLPTIEMTAEDENKNKDSTMTIEEAEKILELIKQECWDIVGIENQKISEACDFAISVLRKDKIHNS